MKEKSILILGAGEQARIVLDILRENNKEIFGFVDICDNSSLWGKKIKDYKILGGMSILSEIFKQGVKKTIVAFGDNKKRLHTANRASEIGFELVNAISPSAFVSQESKLGEGIVIGPKVIINTDVGIEDNAIINSGAIIEHDCIIEQGVHIAPGANLAGGVRVKRCAFIGIGATIIDDLIIGENSIVGAGSVIIKNIPDNVTVVGVPGEIIKEHNVHKYIPIV
ncbi:MAG: acetyltransferase [bacterium]